MAERHYCRNLRCRSKLPAPVDNHHRAFCTRGCFDSFYRKRCRVCEKPLRDSSGRRLYCRAPNKCASEAQKWPHVYAYAPYPTKTGSDLRSAHFTGLKTGLRADPPFRCLRHWQWTDEADLELELHDDGGLVLARLEHNRGRYRLTHPCTYPILSWPKCELAKRGAESIVLGALVLRR
jgi:hypothetical protein